jgi:hypothetical protein
VLVEEQSCSGGGGLYIHAFMRHGVSQFSITDSSDTYETM